MQRKGKLVPRAVDKSFPPSNASLFGGRKDKMKISLEDKSHWLEYEWKHICEIPSMNPHTIASSISPLAVKQGHVGNCYFVSAMIALALVPERVAKLIITKAQPSADGYYQVQAFPMGSPVTFELDGYFPYSQAHASLAFTTSQALELWPLLLEKAWAKHLGSYQAMSGMNPSMAFKFLSGCPVTTIAHATTTAEELWTKMIDAQERGYAITTENEALGKDQPEYIALGIVPNHAYTVLGLNVEQGSKRPQRLVQLRNPWGRLEWQGSVATISNILPSYVLSKGEGTFYIRFESYFEYFTNVTICHIHPGYTLASIASKLESDAHELLVEFEVTSPGHAYFTLYEDLYGPQCVSGLIVGRQNPHTSHWEYINSLLKSSYAPTIECDLIKPGKYFCFCQNFDGLKLQHRSVCLRVYSSEALRLQEVKSESAKLNFLRSVLRSCAIKKGVKVQIAPAIYQYDCFAESGLYYSAVCYLNWSEDCILHVSVKYKESKQYVTLLAPESGFRGYQLSVPSQSERTVAMQICPGINTIDCTKHNLVEKPQPRLLREIQAGILKLISEKKIIEGVLQRIYQHDLGMVFEYSNQSKNLHFYGRISFVLKNLRFDHGGNVIEVSLAPGSVHYSWAVFCELFNGGGKYSIRYSYDTKRLDRTNEEIINELTTSGQKREFSLQKGFLFTKYIDGDYCLYVRNLTNETLTAEVTFKNPANLDCKNGDKWEVTITPSQRGQLRIVKRLKPFISTQCGYNIIYVFA